MRSYRSALGRISRFFSFNIYLFIFHYKSDDSKKFIPFINSCTDTCERRKRCVYVLKPHMVFYRSIISIFVKVGHNNDRHNGNKIFNTIKKKSPVLSHPANTEYY